MFKKIELWLWKHHLHPLSWQGYKYYAFGGGDPVSLVIAAAVTSVAAVGASAIQSSAQKKAASNAADLAREQQSNAIAEQKRLEEKYGLTPGELSRQTRIFGDIGAKALAPGQTFQDYSAKQKSDFEANIAKQKSEFETQLAKDKTRQQTPQAAALQQVGGSPPFDETARRQQFEADILRQQQEFDANLKTQEQGFNTTGMVGGDIGLEAKLQNTLEQRAGMTGEELLKSVGPDTKALLENIAQRQGMTGEELFKSEGAIPQALQDQVLNEVKNPEKFWQDTLNQKLELSRQMVNAEANRRGVFGGTPEGGIRFENLGRAGVDLAIKSAEQSVAQRQQALSNAMSLSGQFFALSQGARGESAVVSQTALGAKDKARNELEAFLQNLQQQDAASKGRAANVGLGAAGITAGQTGNAYDNLIAAEAYKGNIKNPAAAGLSAIGQIGANYVGANLPAPTPKTEPSDFPLTFNDFLKANPQSDPMANMSDYAGNDVFRKKYPYPGSF